MLHQLARALWTAITILIAFFVVPVTRSVAEEAPSASAEPLFNPLSNFAVNDDDPEKSVPTPEQANKDPVQFGYHLMDLTEKAGRATKRGDYGAAAKYWAAVAKAVPDRSVAFSKACTSYEMLGEWEKAIDACRNALGREGVTVADATHFVHLMLDKRTALDKSEVDEVSGVVEHLRREQSGRAAADELQCEIGLRLEDAKRLEECTTALAAVAPNNPKTITYQWALAIQRRDISTARRLIERARATMPPENIQKMEQTTRAAEPLWRKALRDWRTYAGIGLVIIAAIAVRVVGRRRSVMRTV